MIAMMYLVLTALLALNVSKDMLDAFLVVNKSMENTIEVFENKLGTLYIEFENQYQLKPNKVEAYWNRAKEAKRLSNEMKNYIEKAKLEVVAQSERVTTDEALDKYYQKVTRIDPENPRKQVETDVLNMNTVASKDKYDESTNYFINRGEARQMRKKIEEYKAAMLQLVGEEFRGNIQVGLDVDGPFEDADGKNQDWENHNFYHTILAATVTILNKLKAEIQTAEFDVVSELYSEISITDFKFDRIEAKVIPKTTYVLQGERFEADVLVTAFDTKQTPEVFVLQGAEEITVSNKDRAQKVEGKDGVVRLEFPGGATGLQRYAGIIEVISPDGERIPYPFSGEYIVAPPSLTVAATKMNVFYIGVDNPVSISVPGIADADLRASISAGSLSRDPKGRDWIVRVPTGVNKAVITVDANYQGEGRRMGSAEFRVKKVPNPVAEIAGQVEGQIDKNVLLAAGAIIPVMKDFEFELYFKVTSFRMATIIGGDWISKRAGGNRFTDEMLSLIQSGKRGQKFFFENITAEGPDQTARSLNPIAIEIK